MVLNVFNALHINNARHQSLPYDYVNRNHWQCLSMFVFNLESNDLIIPIFMSFLGGRRQHWITPDKFIGP